MYSQPRNLDHGYFKLLQLKPPTLHIVIVRFLFFRLNKPQFVRSFPVPLWGNCGGGVYDSTGRASGTSFIMKCLGCQNTKAFPLQQTRRSYA